VTARRAKFIDEYLIDLNASQAAIRAGYSARNANVEGARLLANVSVSEEIARRGAIQARRTGYNQERVMREIAEVASSPESKMPEKLKALELMGKHMGMFRDNVTVSVEPPRIIDDWSGAPSGADARG
jgi:phage terminase small subunit